MPSVEEQRNRLKTGKMAYFGDNYKEEEAKLFVDAARSQGIYSSSLPASAAIPGTGPKGNKVGSDADPNTPGLQGSAGIGRPGEQDGGLNTSKVRELDLAGANELLSHLKVGQMADVNSFLPAAMPASPNEKPSAPADPNAETVLGGDPVVEGVATQGTNAATSADGADNTRSISVPGENRAPAALAAVDSRKSSTV